MRRVAWICAAALVALGGVGVGLAALRSAPPPRPFVAAAHVGKLRISIPRGFYRYTMRDSNGAQAPVSGEVLTDFPAADIWLSDWFRNGPPADRVGLIVYEVPPGARIGPTNIQLPLSLKQPWYEQHLPGGAVGVRGGDFWIDTVQYHINYWSGPDAPASDRRAVLRALDSIRSTR